MRDRYNLLGLAARLPPAAHQALSQHPGALTQVRARFLVLHVVIAPRLNKAAIFLLAVP